MNHAHIIKDQRQFFASHKTKDINFRIAQLQKLKKALHTNEQKILKALHADLHKPEFEAYTSELYLLFTEISHMIAHIKSWNEPQEHTTALHLFPGKGYVKPEPFGVVLIMAPWNYPLQLLLMPLIGAIAAGNCAILKPSEHAPHTGQLIATFIAETFSPEYITTIQGDADVAQALLKHHFDYIFFTGSTYVGKQVMHAAAEYLTPLTLELGGKSPCIVDKTTSIDCAAKRIVWGKFVNAGQNCISPDYILVHTSIKNQLIKKMQQYIESFYGKNPEESPDYAHIINNKHMNRLAKLLKQGTVITGGTVNQENRYIAPTIMDNVDMDDTIMQEEIFGPILPVIPFELLDQVITIIKSRPKPLALYLFSNNKKIQNLVLETTSAGGMCINDTLLHASSSLPFGGVGKSGFGAYHGKYSFDTFTHKKTIFKNSCLLDTGFRYPPYSSRFSRLIKRFLRWKAK